MPPHKHSIRIRILVHSGLQKLCKILLMRGVLNDGNAQRIMISQVARLGEALAKALDLLNVVNLKHFILAGTLGFKKQRHEHGPLRVRVDAAAGVAARKGCEEERRALAGLVAGRGAQVGAVLKGWILLGGEGEDVDVCVFHEFFLDA